MPTDAGDEPTSLVASWFSTCSIAAGDRRGEKGLAQRVAALERKLRYITTAEDDEKRPEVRITGANLRLVNGLGSTDCVNEQDEEIPDCPNGLGNLIVGYNEPHEPDFGENIRTGSHNVVVGERHNFSRFGGVVVGRSNTISGEFASVTRELRRGQRRGG